METITKRKSVLLQALRSVLTDLNLTDFPILKFISSKILMERNITPDFCLPVGANISQEI